MKRDGQLLSWTKPFPSALMTPDPLHNSTRNGALVGTPMMHLACDKKAGSDGSIKNGTKVAISAQPGDGASYYSAGRRQGGIIWCLS
jgi:hypothetical protein